MIKKKKIVCIGITVLDILVAGVEEGILDRDHTDVESIKCDTGGDALNEAVILSVLGHDSILMGAVGNDFWGEFILKRLKERGLDTGSVYVHPSLSTITPIVLIHKNGERSFLVNKKNNVRFDIRCIDREIIARADAVSIGSIYFDAEMDNSLHGVLSLAKESGALTFGDIVYRPGNDLEKIKDILPLFDFVLPNYEEAKGLTGENDIGSIADAFLKYGVKNVIIKTGEDGCYIKNADEQFTVPAFRVENVLDTTGAGDSFIAGFIAGILEGQDLKTAARFANATAAVNVQGIGATYLKNRADVEKLYTIPLR